MKKILFTGLSLLFGSSALLAQSTYDDDVYMNRSKPQQYSSQDASQNQQQYQTENMYSDDGYIDYDDDSYTTRFRRFGGMSLGSYWSPYYSPYWMDPFFYDPFYTSWFGPRVSINFGFGPYWSSYWGYNNWYGFNNWYNPYSYWGNPWFGGGYGYGYGNYWNGYYDGYYNGHYGNVTRRNVTYGPRTGFGTNRNLGIQSGVRQDSYNRNNNGYIRRDNNNTRSINQNTRQPIRTQPSREIYRNDAPRQSAPIRTQPQPSRSIQQQPSRSIQQQPSRSIQPSRSYSTPNRSFNSGGSRSSGSFNSGGSRSSGGFRR